MGRASAIVLVVKKDGKVDRPSMLAVKQGGNALPRKGIPDAGNGASLTPRSLELPYTPVFAPERNWTPL